MSTHDHQTAAATAPAIETRALAYRYGTTLALAGLDLRVERGELFGLVGPDGAGKTTTIRMLTATLSPTGGEARVVGFDVTRESEHVRERAGYVAQGNALYGDLSVAENIAFFANIFGIGKREREERTAELLEFSGLAPFAGRLADQLSGGMKRKLALATALIHRPEILFLDEPTAGVDPISRRDLWRILDRLRGEGLTIFFSTAYMDEAARCDRLAFLTEGRLVASGTPDELRALVADAIYETRGTPLQLARDVAASLPGVSGATLMGDRLHVAADPTLLDAPTLAARLAAAGVADIIAQRIPPSIEDVFIALRAPAAPSLDQPDLAAAAKPPEAPAKLARSVASELDSALVAPPAQPERDSEGPPTAPVVSLRGLTRRFGSFTAVAHVSLEVRPGEVFGFLGPNGSGKTTTIRMLCGILQPSEGTASIFGRDCWRESSFVKSQIGYMSQKFALYGDLTVRENLDFYARVYGVPAREREARVADTIERTNLRGRDGEIAAGLGGGLRQRLAFGCASLHRPPVIFLDEPTAGVDPVARREFWEVIYALAHDGATIFVTTHYLDEAEYCNRLALMHQGRLIATGTPNDLRKHLPGAVIEVDAEPANKAFAALESHPDLSEPVLFGSTIRVYAPSGAAVVPGVQQSLSDAGLTVRRVEIVAPSLEEVFLALVDNEERQPPGSPVSGY